MNKTYYSLLYCIDVFTHDVEYHFVFPVGFLSFFIGRQSLNSMNKPNILFTLALFTVCGLYYEENELILKAIDKEKTRNILFEQ